MNFLDLQKDLQILIWDTRNEWLADEADTGTVWASNKSAIIHGIKEVFDRLKQNSLYKEQNYTEATLTVSDNKASLPADFEIEHEVLFYDDPTYDYKLNKKSSEIIFDDITEWTITLRYLVKENVLSAAIDEPYLDEHFKEAISLFAQEKYHLAQFDWDNVSKSVAYAEDKLEDLISKYF